MNLHFTARLLDCCHRIDVGFNSDAPALDESQTFGLGEKAKDQYRPKEATGGRFSWRPLSFQASRACDVAYWHKADISLCAAHVRYWG